MECVLPAQLVIDGGKYEGISTRVRYEKLTRDCMGLCFKEVDGILGPTMAPKPRLLSKPANHGFISMNWASLKRRYSKSSELSQFFSGMVKLHLRSLQGL